MMFKFKNDDEKKRQKEQNSFKRKRPEYEVLYVEKDSRVREIIGSHLSTPRYSYTFLVTKIESNDDALLLILKKKFDLVLLDGDQFNSNLKFVKSMIRRTYIFMPILFCFVDKFKVQKTDIITTPLDKAIDKYSLYTTIKGPSILHSMIQKSIRIRQIAKELIDKHKKDKGKESKDDSQ